MNQESSPKQEDEKIIGEMTDGVVTKVKLEINELIWMYSPAGTTLKTADEVAGHILECIAHGEIVKELE